MLTCSEEASLAGLRHPEGCKSGQGTRCPLMWDEPAIAVLFLCLSRLVSCRAMGSFAAEPAGKVSIGGKRRLEGSRSYRLAASPRLELWKSGGSDKSRVRRFDKIIVSNHGEMK